MNGGARANEERLARFSGENGSQASYERVRHPVILFSLLLMTHEYRQKRQERRKER